MIVLCYRLLPLLTSAAMLAGCQKTRPPMNADESLVAQQLSGAWDMELQLIRSPLIALDTTHVPREIRGKLDLLVNTSLNTSFGGVGIPTNYGSYDLDLTPFGFDPRITGTPPTAVAGLKSGDSVAIMLSPGNGTGEMLLTGRLSDSTIAGTWQISRERSTGNGRFVLKRTPASGFR